MRTLLIIIALILAGSLLLNGYLLWDKRQAQKERFADNSRLNEVIQSRTAEISKADSVVKALQSKVVKDSLNYLRSTTGLKQANSSLSRKLVKLRPLIMPQVTQNDTLRAYVAVTDSLLSTKDSLLYRQEVFFQLQVADLQQIIQLQNEKFIAQEAISEAWRTTAGQAQQDAVNEKRRKGFWKVTSGILAGGILFMAARD